ncbi:hypothetical protein ORD22_04350 [Sporosarcina sp. GW1-11]|nr:hypothetical protein [Sporosarcina sp. GW1-11]MDV6377490.1 hypothetical protein [Sporosarcina sp. GW1-11]
MNKRQTILLIIICIAIAIYCWILFFELPDKIVQGRLVEYIEGGKI